MGLKQILRWLFLGDEPTPTSQKPPATQRPTPPPAPTPSNYRTDRAAGGFPPAPPLDNRHTTPAAGVGSAYALPPAAQSPPVFSSRPKLNLDSGPYTPLSTDQVKAAAAGQQFSNFWEFGRRTRIPSATDPRTKLIDQALIGQGLISSDDLVHIHELGDRMDECRPEQLNVHQQADRAVQANLAERKRIKEAKKAASLERKRLHAERVAHNKATDIIYLGRGVSAGLSDRRSNVEKLQSQGLPTLSTPADVATAMEISVSKLRWLAFHAEASTVSHYVQFVVPKKSGGERTLSAPHEQMATAQQWIFENILKKLPTHEAAHGFVPGRSIVTNALPHLKSSVVINCDLTDFFPTVTVHRVIGLFRQIGYSPAVSTVLGLIVTESPRRKVLFNGKPWHVATGDRGLPQGACTSPSISNLIARRLDSRLTGIAKKMGWSYTRYADDLTFSTGQPSERIGYLLARIRHIVGDEGFAVNEKKTRLLKQAARQSVTGVVVNEIPAATRRTRRTMRAILHNAGKTGLDAQNRSREPHFVEKIKGTVAFVAMVNPNHGNALKRAFDRAT